MNKIMISIRPEWLVKILNGEKTIEIRKSFPKCKLPCEVYIYCTKGKQTCFSCDRYCTVDTKDKDFLKKRGITDLQGRVVGNFLLNECEKWDVGLEKHCIKKEIIQDDEVLLRNEHTCVLWKDLWEYAKGKPIYTWKIENLKIFDTPKTLQDFGLTHAPQSWCYIKEEK